MLASPATFLDSNAGAPLASRVAEALLPLLHAASSAALGNPSSAHAAGRKARFALQTARDQVAASLGCQNPSQILFTSSGTESIQVALRSLLEPALRSGQKPHLVTSALEHEAVLQMASWLEARGGRVSWLPHDASGVIQPGSVTAALEGFKASSEPSIVSLLWVNNETGVVQSIYSLIEEARALGARVHVDAAQAWGKLPIQIEKLGADFISMSAHKIGGLSGTGALWIRSSLSEGVGILGKQELSRRGGTENLLGIVAAGAAATLITPEWLEVGQSKIAASRDQLEDSLRARLKGIRVNGYGAPRVANTLNFSITGIEKPGLVAALDLDGFAVSSGAACSSGVEQPSHVLRALGLGEGLARSSVRVSMATPLELEKIEAFTHSVDRYVSRAKALSSGVVV